MTVEAHIGDLLQRHCATLVVQVDAVSQLLAKCRCAGVQSLTSIADAQNITHQIKGTSGTMGFRDVAAAAAALDDKLKVFAKQHSISESQLTVTKELCVRLHKIASETVPERSALYATCFPALPRP